MIPKLLLVENDDITRAVIKAALKKIYRLDLAEDGETAIKLAGKTKYSIILMDIALGYGLDGIETSKIIRKISGYKNIPIVAMTAFTMSGDKEILISQGLTHYLRKPFDLKHLKKIISDILNESL
jgi:CheY-like chemotaxis protein